MEHILQDHPIPHCLAFLESLKSKIELGIRVGGGGLSRPMRERVTDHERAEIIRSYRAGEFINTIANAMSRDKTTVRNVLVRAGEYVVRRYENSRKRIGIVADLRNGIDWPEVARRHRVTRSYARRVMMEEIKP